MKLSVKDLVELYTALSQGDVYSVYVNEKGKMIDYSYKQANTFVSEIEEIHKRVGIDVKVEETNKDIIWPRKYTLTSCNGKTYVYGIKPDDITRAFNNLITPLEGITVEINELM